MNTKLTVFALAFSPFAFLSAVPPSNASAEPVARAASVATPSARRDVFERKGKILAWHVDKAGAVALLLESQKKDGEKTRSWFRTPPSTTERTMLEHMLIVVGLHAKAAALDVVLRGERSDANDGRDPEHGFEIESIRSHVPAREDN